MLADLLDLVLPRHCVGCRRPGTALCAACAAVAVVNASLEGLHVVAAAPYEGGLRTALIAYKERGRRDLARPLRALLAAAVTALGCPDAVLVPVPSRAAARRERGADHVRRLVGRRGVPALRLGRTVRDSAGLDTA
ncbi:MAG: ComF family protein, partial [Jatrophihabitantaceae bacterium]